MDFTSVLVLETVDIARTIRNVSHIRINWKVSNTLR